MIVNIDILSWCAKRDPSIWDKVIGCQIMHINSEYGLCLIEKFQEKSYLIIKPNHHKQLTISIDHINTFFSELIIPNNHEELKKIIERLLIYKDNDELLTSKRKEYDIPIFKDVILNTKIYLILSKIANNEILDKDDEKLLFNHNLFKTLAKYHEEMIDKDKWSIAKAGKYWRYAQNPKRSLELSNIVINNDNKLNSAIQTNRGAAFLDLGMHEESKRCANKAIEYNDTGCCPFNLLAAIYLDLGDIDKADGYFSIAKDKKGFNDNMLKNEIREIIKKVKLRKDVKKEKRILERYRKIISGTNRIVYEYDDIPF